MLLSRLENAKDGWIFVGVTILGLYEGVSGSGTLATIEFRVLTEGESEIKIETDPIWIDRDGDGEVDPDELIYPTRLIAQYSPVPPPQWEDIPFTAGNGYFSSRVLVWLLLLLIYWLLALLFGFPIIP